MTQLAGALESIGLEEVEPGCVEDSPMNRRLVRMQGTDWQWEHIFNEDGQPTGLIRVFTPEQVTRRRNDVYDRRRDLLTDPEDKWSDYVGPEDYPLEPEAPYWILSRLARWKRDARNGVPEDEREAFPSRCEIIRHDGTRCWNWASHPERMPRCRAHLGWTKDVESRVAAFTKQRILESAPDAADSIIELSRSAEGEAVRLKASTEILDRAGVRGGVELDVHHEVEVVDPSLAVKAKLDQLSKRAQAKLELEAQASAAAAETVAGEVVESEPVSAESHDRPV